ncbi:MAG TPA: aldehyde dehydrogenase family protein [Streptosporangiaceae bacterium]|nr:aldehyde dehydrogenase family protein [Streptosporangiaceae bacterium]
MDTKVAGYAERPWHMLIGGDLVTGRTGTTMPVIHPGDESVIAPIPLGDAADVDDAVAAARKAARPWARTPIAERAATLNALADLVLRHGEELAWLDTLDNGSPIAVMRNDYQMAADQLRYVAGLALQLRGQTLPAPRNDALDFTVRDPFGVVGRLIPFNHPLMFAASRIAAPLLAGNTVVLKPSEQTSLSALRLGELARPVVPKGVLNVVTGIGQTVGDALVAHPHVPRIAFTGSETTGRRIRARAAASPTIKTVTLELGGKNPLIVFPDADLPAAVDGALRGMNFRRQGQSCGSTSRLFVHRTRYKQFIADLAARMQDLKLGDPLDETTDVGPLVSKAHYERVRSFIEQGTTDPQLELVTGSKRRLRVGQPQLGAHPRRGLRRREELRPRTGRKPGGDRELHPAQERLHPLLKARKRHEKGAKT